MYILFSIMPFGLAIWIGKASPSKIKYLPPHKKLVLDDYLGNVKVEIDTSFPIEKQLINGYYDPIVHNIIDEHVKKDFVCIDVGANIGAISLALAQKIAPTGKLFCIEPGQENFQKLCNNFKLNPELNGITQSYQLGLSDKEGTLNWSEDPNNLGNATLLSAGGIPVPVTTLDIFCRSNAIEKLDFVKVDVEGMEYEVLKGGEQVINNYRPLLFLETNPLFETARQMPLSSMIFDLLSDWKYKVVDPLNLEELSFMPKNRNDILAYPADKPLKFKELPKEPT
jgi:FkbM family methyltransferase